MQLDPSRTAVVTQECQRGVLGDPAIFPELARIAAERGIVPRIAALCDAARRAGAAVIHCVAARRPDGRGSNHNARLFTAAARAPVQLHPGTPAVEVLPELGPDPADLVLTRLHGIGPMAGTELDPVLRNLGVDTVIAVGVSLNIGLTDLVFDAVGLGYRVVVPRDAVCGVPADYGDAVLTHTLSLLADIVETEQVVAALG